MNSRQSVIEHAEREERGGRRRLPLFCVLRALMLAPRLQA